MRKGKKLKKIFVVLFFLKIFTTFAAPVVKTALSHLL